MTGTSVRVRFAPSPTGPLHMGGVRTALYNYLFARKMGGTFVLRIEDTDQTRFVEGAEAYITEALDWCGLHPDESPAAGGDFGPYRQSERKDLYRQYVDRLVEAGHAYYAFDTPEALDAQREAAIEAGEGAWKYDGKTRTGMANSLSLDEAEVKTRIERGDDYVIRLRTPENETIVFSDLIRGEVRVHTSQMDDKVLFKSDGMPTYHLANIVDDHLMQITHVIRGEEWLPSAPLHVLLYRCFGWEKPEFAHLPLILKPEPSSYINKRNRAELAAVFTNEYLKATEGADEGKTRNFIEQLFADPKGISGRLKIKDNEPQALQDLKAFLKSTLYGKLSKRDGDRLGFPVFPLNWHNAAKNETAAGYREAGYFADAFANLLAFLGWNPGTEQELFSLEELMEAFSLERVGKAGARFTPDKARWYNQQYLWQKSDEMLAGLLQPMLAEAGIETDLSYCTRVVAIMKQRVHFVAEMVASARFFFEAPASYDEDTVAKKWKPETPGILADVIGWLNEQATISSEVLEPAFKDFLEAKEISFGAAALPLRVALTGSGGGPGLFDIVELIGREEAVQRIERAIDQISAPVAS